MKLRYSNLQFCAEVEPIGNHSYSVRSHVDLYYDNKREVAGFVPSADGQQVKVLFIDGGSVTLGKDDEIPVTSYASRRVSGM